MKLSSILSLILNDEINESRSLIFLFGVNHMTEIQNNAYTYIGVTSVSLEGDDKDRICVTGDNVDIVCLANQLKKKFNNVTILTTEEVKKKTEAEKKKEKEEEKKKIIEACHAVLHGSCKCNNFNCHGKCNSCTKCESSKCDGTNCVTICSFKCGNSKCDGNKCNCCTPKVTSPCFQPYCKPYWT